jgi:hypothetical protein
MVAEYEENTEKFRNRQKIQNRKFILKNKKLAQVTAREPFFNFA